MDEDISQNKKLQKEQKIQSKRGVRFEELDNTEIENEHNQPPQQPNQQQQQFTHRMSLAPSTTNRLYLFLFFFSVQGISVKTQHQLLKNQNLVLTFQ